MFPKLVEMQTHFSAKARDSTPPIRTAPSADIVKKRVQLVVESPVAVQLAPKLVEMKNGVMLVEVFDVLGGRLRAATTRDPSDEVARRKNELVMGRVVGVHVVPWLVDIKMTW